MTTFRIEAEPIEFRTLGGPAPDPDWSFTDKEGHRHTTGKEEDLWPTLTWVVDETWWCEDCRDEHREGHWECRVCGEAIEPGMVTRGPRTSRVSGPRSFYLDDRPVTEEEFRAAAEAEGVWV